MATEIFYSQDVEFKASLSLETQRIPDPYHYYFKEGKLYSPITKAPVEDSITIDNPMEEAESAAFQKIQKWFSECEEGSVVWISPSNSRDVSTKIIISEIVDTSLNKRLRNRAVCLDLNHEECLLLAKKIGLTDNISDSELASYPLFPHLSSQELVRVLEEYTPRQADLIRSGEDFLIKERVKAELALGYPVLIGPYAPSCASGPSSAFNVMFGDSFNMSESFFDCPKCHGPIPSGRGITTCPHCKARKEDYQGGCD